MRQRRIERLVTRATAAIDAGNTAEATEALEEVERLDRHSPQLADLRARLLAPRAAPPEKTPIVDPHPTTLAPEPRKTKKKIERVVEREPQSILDRKIEEPIIEPRVVPPALARELGALAEFDLALPEPVEIAREPITDEPRRRRAWPLAAAALVLLGAGAWFIAPQTVRPSLGLATSTEPAPHQTAAPAATQPEVTPLPPVHVAVDDVAAQSTAADLPVSVAEGTHASGAPPAAPVDAAAVDSSRPEAVSATSERGSNPAPVTTTGATPPAVERTDVPARREPPVSDPPLASRTEPAGTPAPPAAPPATTPPASKVERPAAGTLPPPPPVSVPAAPVAAGAPSFEPMATPAAPDSVRDAPVETRREPPRATPEPALEAADTAAAATANVRAVLGQYEAAYSRLDVDGTAAVWPGVDRRALTRAFDGLASQRVTLGSCDVRLVGETALAECAGSATWTPKVGSGAQTSPRHWEFRLRNTGGRWQIVSARVR
jgi:hypothetical protein